MSIFFVIAIIAALFAFLFLCGKFAKWFLFGSPQEDEPVQPLMSQTFSYGSAEAQSHAQAQCQPSMYIAPMNTETVRIVEGPQAPAYPQYTSQPTPQSPASYAPGEYTDPRWPEYSEQEPTRPATPYYQPQQPGPVYNTPVQQAFTHNEYYQPVTPASGPAPQHEYYEPLASLTPAQPTPAYDDYQAPDIPLPDIEPIAPPDFSAIPPYPLPAQDDPASYYEPMFRPPAITIDLDTVSHVTGSLAIEPGTFEIPEIFAEYETPVAAYPDMPIVDADLSYTGEE